MRWRDSMLAGAMTTVLIVGVVLLTPVARAQEAVASTESLPGAGQGSDQGEGQGAGQGVGQGDGLGGPTLESLGLTPDENGNYDTSVLGADDPRQGANQGVGQGLSQGTANGSTTATASNADTGADSTNTSTVDTSQTSTSSTTNAGDVTTNASGSANSGSNSASENTGNASVTTGNAGIGVQQVTADNFNTSGSTGEISHGVVAGSQEGDLVLDFTPSSGGDALNDSFRSTNSVTGSGSMNDATVSSNREEILEIQNDGTLTTNVDATANSGGNDASQNTGNASIETGDANAAAVLMNFLNANVVDGALWLEVVDIFGDLNGNVVVPDQALAYLRRREEELLVQAANQTTGSDSTNAVEVNVDNTDTTTLTNTAVVENNVGVGATTGQNATTQNTGHSIIETGDAEATVNTVTLANLNVLDGVLGLIIVNALNMWQGFLLGTDGSWTPIDHDFSTLAAQNDTTGANSTNTATVDVTNSETTAVVNDATITNNVNLSANTGGNTATQNTGTATVRTGDARAMATVVNVANVNVVHGGFFATIVNIFGNWLGDVFFGSTPVRSLASSGGAAAPSGGVEIQAENAETGSGSGNTIDVDLSHVSTTEIENTARITNTITVDADTGHNQADRNTGLASIDTGDALLSVHARNIANVTLAHLGSGWANVTADLLNATTGADSTNTIEVNVNDERNVTVLNDAAVDTAVGAVANTGFNTANRNTLGGLVLTGDSTIVAFLENLLNQTWFLGYEYGDTPGVQIAGANQATGSDSTNSISTDVDQNTNVDVASTADVTTDLGADATTGNNQASRNTGGGAVGSGDATIRGGADTVVNSTELEGAVPGSLALGIVSDANVQTTADANASTGGNEANRNTGALALPGSASASSASSGGSAAAAPWSGGASSGSGGGGTSAGGSGSSGGGEEEPTPVVQKAVKKSKKPPVRPRRRVRGVPPRTARSAARVAPRRPYAAKPRLLGIATAAAAGPLELIPPPVRPLEAVSRRAVASRIMSEAWPWGALTAATVLGLSSRGGGLKLARRRRPL